MVRPYLRLTQRLLAAYRRRSRFGLLPVNRRNSMTKFPFAAVELVALVVTSFAVAHGIEGAKSAKAVAGTFNATGTSTSSRTCTTTDGKTIVVTDGKYTGVAAGDPDLTGPITLRARSVINTTDNVGIVEGRFS